VTATPVDVLSAAQSTALIDFARACKAAAGAVSLYPDTHPAIASALARVTAVTSRLVTGGEVTLSVHPETLLADGRPPVRPDAALEELAELLHDRLIGAMAIAPGTDAADWHALLHLVARTREDLLAAGGIAKAWAETGRTLIRVREIDYAEVLRERGGGDAAEWDRIVAHCLRGDATSLDEQAIAALISALSDSETFADLLQRFQHEDASGPSIGARAAALLKLLRIAADGVDRGGGGGANPVIATAARSAIRFTPEMMLAIVAHRRVGTPEDAALVEQLIDDMTDESIATFVAASVAAERGATERLAQAFQVLVPEAERQPPLLDLAHDEAAHTALGRDRHFEDLWQSAASMLLSYSDANFVSAEYGRELTAARSHAVEVERVADDPPERVASWLASVDEAAVRQLDLDLVLDLLRLEPDPAEWQVLANIAVEAIERRTVIGDTAGAHRLAAVLAADLAAGTDGGRPQLRGAAREALERLAAGPVVRHVVLSLRTIEEAEVPAIVALCHTIGPALVRPLAEALAVEENTRAIRRLRELLLGYGADGRHSVEQLKASSNPSVRRTAIDLLRVFGGHEALPELASMLDDPEPQVQRESIRAIVQIGTPQAYAVLERTLVAASASRATVVQELISLRDDKTIPLLCYVLNHTPPRREMAQVHADVMDALGGLSVHPESTRTLRRVLYAGQWWAPFRTGSLRHAAALALRRLDTPEARAVLDEAIAGGRRGVRNAVRRAMPNARTTP